MHITDHFGAENVEIRDMQNGWWHYTVRNTKAGEMYIIFTCYFNEAVLQMVDFVVSNKRMKSGSWDDWSEQKELENLAFYKHWLTSQIGNTRGFSWGSIDAFYDKRSGGASIVLRYKA